MPTNPPRLKALEGVTAKDAFGIPPGKIEVEDGFNARNFTTPETIEHIERLSHEIALQGVLVPITVRYVDGRIILVDGQCRLKAANLAIKRGAKIERIPAQLEGRSTSDSDRLVGQVMRNSGLPFTMLERGEIYARLYKMGKTESEIAGLFGHTTQNIRDVMELYSAPDSVKQIVADGSVSASRAIKTVRHQGSSATDVLRKGVEAAKAEGKTRATGRHFSDKDTQGAPTRAYPALVEALKAIRICNSISKAQSIANDALTNAGEPVK